MEASYRDFVDSVVAQEPNGAALREMLVRPIGQHTRHRNTVHNDYEQNRTGIYMDLPPVPLLPKVRT